MAEGDTFVVEGGREVGGTLQPAGNKNEALPVLAATLLAPGEIRLSNVQSIRDTDTLCTILGEMGVRAGRDESADEFLATVRGEMDWRR